MTSQAAALFQNVKAEGVVSASALRAINIQDIGEDINAALGVAADQVQASEVTLVTLLIDDSGSIRFGSMADAVRTGHNGMLDALRASKQKSGILVMTRYLNGNVLYPYCLLDQALQMDASNYNPNGGTPLYDEAVVTCAAVLAKCQEFMDNGIPCRTVTGIITDGADAGSRKQSPASVKAVISDMLKAENHIVAGMGIDDGSTDFRHVFQSMGIPDAWILTPGNTPSEIRRAFAMVSQSAVRASQGAATFSQQAMGGFGSP